jgi:YegS/Rv2252/BmrU family lipid kinase
MNDKAGKYRLTPGVEDMRKFIEHLELRLDVIGTKSERHMIEVLQKLVAQGTPRIAVAGGDGTVSTAIQVLAQTDSALGILPQGTANNFATALHVPQDLPSALRCLEEGEIMEVDLGRIGKRYFMESAGVGLFADALSLYGSSNKNPFRTLYTVFRLIVGLRAHRVRLTIDGEAIEEPAVMCAVANSFRMAHSLALAPSAKVTDGLLDLVIFGDLDRSELLPYYRALRAQMHTSLPKCKIRQAKTIKIESRRRLPVNTDDKVLFRTPVTIETAPKALKVVVEKL